MTAKKNSLQATLDRVKSAPAPAPEAPASTRRRAAGTTRENTRLVAGHFSPEVVKQLRIIAAERDTTMQSLLAEALDLLFLKEGKARIENL